MSTISCNYFHSKCETIRNNRVKPYSNFILSWKSPLHPTKFLIIFMKEKLFGDENPKYHLGLECVLFDVALEVLDTG